MRGLRRFTLASVAWLGITFVMLPGGDQARADAAGDFQQTWQRLPSAPAEAHAAWKALAEKHPQDDLGRVARLLAGMALLRDGNDEAHRAAALALFRLDNPDQAKGPATQPSAARALITTASKAWQARVQLVQLARALDAYYKHHVRYPVALADLAKAGLAQDADLTDPYGKPFAYAAAPRKTMPKVPQQVYSLRCTALDEKPGDLALALALAAEPVNRLTVRAARPDKGDAQVIWVRPDGSPTPLRFWGIGEGADDVALWLVGERFVIVGQRDAPKVVPVQ